MAAILLFFLLLPAFATAQNITVGGSLSADAANSTAWLSPSGEFAFGFRPLDEANTTFLLCIWYAGIPDRTIVWSANGDSPVPAGSTVQLAATAGLILANPAGSEIWRSGQLSGGVNFASLTDSGNFMIRDRNSSPLWETFGNPTDTILPSQTLGSRVLLSSRRSESNFSKGRFRLILQGNGELFLNTVNLPTEQLNSPYYSAGTGSDTDRGTQLAFDELGFLSVVRTNGGSRFNLTGSVPLPSSSNGGFYHRATLRFDGVLTQYYYPRSGGSNRSWTLLWNQPENICFAMTAVGSGTCGFNSICDLESDGRPSCRCPTGYSLMDPNDPYGNCRANYTQGCEEDNGGVPIEELYGFEEIENTDWPTSDYALLPLTEEGCRNSCLHDCMCVAAISRSGDMCWKKKMPLSNGRVDGNLNGKALLKVRRGNVSPRNGGGGRSAVIISVLVLFCSSAVVNLFFLALFVSRKRKGNDGGSGGIEYSDREVDSLTTNLQKFSYGQLEMATGGFKEVLGSGSSGTVYKGVLSRNQQVVAVKMLDKMVSKTQDQEFSTEVKVIGATNHKNLVKLVGFCNEGQHRLLVYEYMSNGSLADLLFDDGDRSRPSWYTRTEIAYAVSKGLVYLHEECSTHIIHCDIKPQNILLDESMIAKISDFGLAKLLKANQTRTMTGIRGTRGYVAPEWFKAMPITSKVDVHSFGILLLELVCCRKNLNMEAANEEEIILADWVVDCYSDGKLGKLVKNDKEAMADMGRVERLVKVAIWCLQDDPIRRPEMKKVAQMLEGSIHVPTPPDPESYLGTI